MKTFFYIGTFQAIMGYKKGENGFALICNDAEYVGNITLTSLFIQHLSEKVYHSFSIW